MGWMNTPTTKRYATTTTFKNAVNALKEGWLRRAKKKKKLYVCVCECL